MLKFEPIGTDGYNGQMAGTITISQSQEDHTAEATMAVDLRRLHDGTMAEPDATVENHLTISDEVCPFNPEDSRRTPYDNVLTQGDTILGGPAPTGEVTRTRMDGLLTKGSAEVGVACGQPFLTGTAAFPYSECVSENVNAMDPIVVANIRASSYQLDGKPTSYATLAGIPLSGPDSVLDGRSLTVWEITPASCTINAAADQARAAECSAVDISKDRAFSEHSCLQNAICDYTAAVLSPVACANFNRYPVCSETHSLLEEAIDGENTGPFDTVRARLVLDIPWEMFSYPSVESLSRIDPATGHTVYPSVGPEDLISAADCDDPDFPNDRSPVNSAPMCLNNAVLQILKESLAREIADFINCRDAPIDRLEWGDEHGNPHTPTEYEYTHPGRRNPGPFFRNLGNGVPGQIAQARSNRCQRQKLYSSLSQDAACRAGLCVPGGVTPEEPDAADRIVNVEIGAVEEVFAEFYTTDADGNPQHDTPPFHDNMAFSFEITGAGCRGYRQSSDFWRDIECEQESAYIQTQQEEELTPAEILHHLGPWIAKQNELLGDQRFNTNHGTSAQFAPKGHTFPLGMTNGDSKGEALVSALLCVCSSSLY